MYVERQARVTSDRLLDLVALAARLDVRPGPGGSTASDSAATQAIYEPLLGDLIEGDWTKAQIFALWPSSQIVGHCDPSISGTRFHLPLQTNDGCWVYHGEWVQLRAGHLYQMNPMEFHGAVNWGTTLRLHLVIDIRSSTGWENLKSR